MDTDKTKIRISSLPKQELLTELAPKLELLQKLSGFLTRGAYHQELLTQAQNLLIHIGSFLEDNYSLQNTPVLRLLENGCEMLYRIATQEDAASDIRVFSGMADSILSTLDESFREISRRLSITAIFRNEGRYIEEWLCCHKLHGVEHFYLYDNESTDNTAQLLKPYLDAGLVTLVSWPGEQVQLSAYDHAVSHYKNETDYMAFLDIDEFLVPLLEEESLPDIVAGIISDHETRPFRLSVKVGGIGVCWRMYGTSHHKTSPGNLVIEDYLYRAEDHFPESHHFKVITNPRAVEGFPWTAHVPQYKDGCMGITENGTYLTYAPIFRDSRFERLQLNHYYTKSEAEFYAKMQRGWPDQPHIRQTDAYIAEELKKREPCNEIYDPVLLRDAPAVRSEIRRMRHRTADSED